MKVLMCHNFYRMPGGEDQVFADECWLLQEHGHEVFTYTANNSEIDRLSRTAVVKKTFWNRRAYADVSALIERHRPDVLHCANTFPLLSPSIYYAAARAGVPVVQTLHNFRLFCPAATMLRDGRICRSCQVKRFAWPGVVHGCYQQSRSASLVAAATHGYHRWRGTWNDTVTRYIALTKFAKREFERAGMAGDKIDVKPNFVRPDPGFRSQKSDYAIFVGRLSAEKGVDVLLDAWRHLALRIPLKIVGDGPLRSKVQDAADRYPQIEWLGQQPFERTLELIAAARMLIFPSIWFETFGRSMIEAKATGTPVVASNLGAMEELNTHLDDGIVFSAGDPADLAEKVGLLLEDSHLERRLAQRGRVQFEENFTADRNLSYLLEIYNRALSSEAHRLRE